MSWSEPFLADLFFSSRSSCKMVMRLASCWLRKTRDSISCSFLRNVCSCNLTVCFSSPLSFCSSTTAFLSTIAWALIWQENKMISRYNRTFHWVTKNVYGFLQMKNIFLLNWKIDNYYIKSLCACGLLSVYVYILFYKIWYLIIIIWTSLFTSSSSLGYTISLQHSSLYYKT